ncbi:MAG: hypothetical protein AAGI46_10430 [Planctomycetota bacterium]
MPVYAVPPSLTKFVVAKGSDGSFVVTSETDRSFVIPCRDQAQAEAICSKLNAGDHDGTLQVDLL